MKIIFTAFIILIASYTHAQISFEKIYGGTGHITLNDVEVSAGGGYLVCGRVATTLNHYDGYLARLDPFGNKIWEEFYHIQDSSVSVDHVIMPDSNTIILQCNSEAYTNAYYNVPRLYKADSLGSIVDTFMVDISGVYNDTYNYGLLTGSNETYWTITFIGTIGISNEFTMVHQDNDLNVLSGLNTGAFYDLDFNTNSLGEFAVMNYPEEWDSINGVYEVDHIRLYDNNGSLMHDSSYLYSPRSDLFFRTNDHGFTSLRMNNDSLNISHFDQNCVRQHVKEIFADTLRASVLSAVLSYTNGYFLLLASFDSTIHRQYYKLIKMDNNDNFMWTYRIPRPYLKNFKDIEATPDGGCILLFEQKGFVDSADYLIKIGPDGEHSPYQLALSSYNFCEGDTISLSATGNAQSYLWSTGETTPQINVSESGFYDVQLTDSIGNIISIERIHITFDPPFPVHISDIYTCNSYVNYDIGSFNGYIDWSNGSHYHITSYYRTHFPPDTVIASVMLTTFNGCMNSDTATFIFENCNSINEIERRKITLHPNPASNDFYFELPEAETLEDIFLVSSDGKKSFVKYSADGNKVRVFSNDLKEGGYIIKCITNKNIYSSKLILTHR